MLLLRAKDLHMDSSDSDGWGFLSLLDDTVPPLYDFRPSSGKTSSGCSSVDDGPVVASDAKKADKLNRNRLSAKRCRQRKKLYMQQLVSENAELKVKIAALELVSRSRGMTDATPT